MRLAGRTDGDICRSRNTWPRAVHHDLASCHHGVPGYFTSAGRVRSVIIAIDVLAVLDASLEGGTLGGAMPTEEVILYLVQIT